MNKGLVVLLCLLVVIALAAAVYHFLRPVGKTLVFKDQDYQIETFSFLHSPVSEKSIIIYPPTGGMNILDELYAEDLFRAGFDVYIMISWTGSDEINYDLELHQRFYERVQRGIGLIISQIKSPYIGMLGTSVGAIHTSVAMSTHDRLNAAVAITGGIPIPEVIVTSAQDAMQVMKAKRMASYGFKTEEEYLKKLHAAFHLDPEELDKKWKEKKLGVVTASRDITVPTKNQENLRSFWNAQEIARFDLEHRNSIIIMGLFHRQKVVDFFSP